MCVRGREGVSECVCVREREGGREGVCERYWGGGGINLGKEREIRKGDWKGREKRGVPGEIYRERSMYVHTLTHTHSFTHTHALFHTDKAGRLA